VARFYWLKYSVVIFGCILTNKMSEKVCTVQRKSPRKLEKKTLKKEEEESKKKSVTPKVNDMKEKKRKQEIDENEELKKASQIMIKQYEQSIQNGKPLGKVLWKKVEYS
jgi:hypothetical protein